MIRPAQMSVSGHKVASASFSLCQSHPSWPGGAMRPNFDRDAPSTFHRRAL